MGVSGMLRFSQEAVDNTNLKRGEHPVFTVPAGGVEFGCEVDVQRDPFQQDAPAAFDAQRRVVTNGKFSEAASVCPVIRFVFIHNW